MIDHPVSSGSTTDPDYNSSAYLIKRLVREHLKPHFKRILLAIVFMLIVSGATAGLAWVMEPAINHISGKSINLPLWGIPIAIMGLTFVKAGGSYASNYLLKRVGQRMITDMQIRLYAHLLTSDISFLMSQSSGSLISRFTNDIMMMRISVISFLTGTMKETVTVFFLIALMFYQNPLLSCVAFFAFPLAILPIYHLGKHMRQVSRKTQEAMGDFTANLDETFQGVRLIKSYNREQHEIARARGGMEKLFKLYVRAIRAEAVSAPMMEILGGIAMASVFAYAGYQISQGTTTLGAFTSFLTSLMLVYKPMRTVSNLNVGVQQGLAATRRLFMIYDIEPRIKDTKQSVPLQLREGAVELEGVSFYYRPDKAALEDVNIRVPAGKMVALVGPSGGGKTTIMNLLLRFYDPEQGRILIDNQDIKQVTISSLRQSISFVSQDIMLFDDTIRNNILYGRLDATEEEVIQAAYSAAAHDFISSLPDGYDTRVGEQGMSLSGGQRQRISIARAMLKNAPILLMDEATSSLDSISEQQIQKALVTLMKNRTTLVIAHRLSTIRNADLIYVIRQGHVAESGSHQELLTKQGYYHKLYHQQFAGGVIRDSDFLDLEEMSQTL